MWGKERSYWTGDFHFRTTIPVRENLPALIMFGVYWRRDQTEKYLISGFWEKGWNFWVIWRVGVERYLDFGRFDIRVESIWVLRFEVELDGVYGFWVDTLGLIRIVIFGVFWKPVD
jgi:hypothetical protein